MKDISPSSKNYGKQLKMGGGKAEEQDIYFAEREQI